MKLIELLKEDFSQEIGEQAADALEKDIRKHFPNVVLENKNLNLKNLLLEAGQYEHMLQWFNDIFHSDPEDEDYDFIENVIRDDFNTIEYLYGIYQKYDFVNDHQYFIELLVNFFNFYKANPGANHEILFLAAILKNEYPIYVKTTYNLQQFQKNLYSLKNDSSQTIYNNRQDLDATSVDEKLSNIDPPLILITRDDDNFGWKIVHGNQSFGISLFLEETEQNGEFHETFKLVVPQGHTFEDIMQQIGEQAADALEKDIHSLYPDVILESKTMNLLKILF